MPELAGGQSLPDDVVFAVRRRDRNKLGTGEFEEAALERRQARRIEMLDYLDAGGGVEAAEPRISIRQRAVKELDALALQRRQAFEVQPIGGHFERAERNIHAGDARELLIFQQN